MEIGWKDAYSLKGEAGIPESGICVSGGGIHVNAEYLPVSLSTLSPGYTQCRSFKKPIFQTTDPFFLIATIWA